MVTEHINDKLGPEGSDLTLIPVVANTWIDISRYVGKLIYFTSGSGVTLAEFSNDGVNPIPYIRSMDLNPSSWSSGGGGSNEWSTNYPAKYIRLPHASSFPAGSIQLYGSFSPIERKHATIISEASVGTLTGIVVIDEELNHDPFVLRTTIDADPNGVQAVIQVEYAGKRGAGTAWVMHTPPTLLGTGGTLTATNFVGASADNEVICAPSQKVCAYFNRVSIYCTAGTVDVEIRSRQLGSWNLATLRRQSDGVLVTQLVAGEVGILENVSFEALQVLQKGAVASNADVIFSEPFKESVTLIDLGAYSGPIAVTSYSNNLAEASLYLHKHY